MSNIVFTATFDQFNVFLLNINVNLLKKKITFLI